MSKPDKNDSKAPTLFGIQGDTEAEIHGKAALRPSINALLVIDAFKKNVVGKDADTMVMLEALQDCMREVKNGDLTALESMLIGQATALQTMFTSMALRASSQEYLPNYQAFMALALKAQNQSRATIQSLVDLKYPKQATFVRQANIAHGPQQVNNGKVPTCTVSHAEKFAPPQNKLLEQDLEQDQMHRLDAGKTGAPGRGHSAMATVEKVHRPAKRRR